MIEFIDSPEDSALQQFKQGSLRLLAKQLATTTYPGYPQQNERLWVPELPDTDTVLLPPGPWERTNSTPTEEERTLFAAQGLQLDADGRPLHPWFKDMITDPNLGVVTGKGFYWRWGPNYTADPIIVRRDLGEPHVLLITRKDTGKWALPGGFLDPGEDAYTAAIREAQEEALIDLHAFGATIRETFHGPLADLRVTAHAWPETTACLCELPDETARHLSTEPYKADDDADTAAWLPVSQLGDYLFGSHLLLIQHSLQLPRS